MPGYRELFALALVIPMSGCWWLHPCGGGEGCADPEPIEDGLWEIDSHDREDLVDGVLEVRGDTVTIEYIDDLGEVWEVEYAVVERFPEG